MGLMPENTLAAMLNSVDLGVNTLEMDLVVTKDGKVILSHDLYFHHRYSTRPDGSSIKKGEPKEYIWTMPYDSVLKYDVGAKYNEDWPEKKCMPAVKQLASEVIASVEDYTRKKGLKPMKYNIEIKSDFDGDGGIEGIHWPDYKTFVDYCAPVLQKCGLGDRLIIQSFDPRALNYLHEKYPEFTLSYLIRDYDVDFEKFMAALDFTPEWLSPPHDIVTAEFLAEAWDRGMKVVSWTVDDPQEMKRLIDLKIEGIITNYPDRLLNILQ
jgi:glycerophosphoryl diester phosphodiesterase